jgi:DNA (cytosine-5)-methyltransferase 1
MAAYYNEHDPKAAAWLRELIRDGLIADGEVDTRSIVDVRPADLRGFQQCHFFAGIGGWSYALRLAGWPDDRAVWTGSCPCQPFSAAGKGHGEADTRHLWPAWFKLIRECRPRVVFGEQVAAAARTGWIDAVFADMEGVDYACGAVVLGAHSVGAPHLRQRLWFVAKSNGEHGMAQSERAERRPWRTGRDGADSGRSRGELAGPSEIGLLADWFVAESNGRDTLNGGLQRGGKHGLRAQGGCTDGPAGVAERAKDGMADHDGEGRSERGPSHDDHGRDARGHDVDGRGAHGERMGDASGTGQARERDELPGAQSEHEWRAASEPGGSWTDLEWLPCRDGNARPTQRGLFPMVTRLPSGLVPSGDPSASYANDTAEARVMRLRGYGNAIVPQVAAEFIQAYLEVWS